MYNGGVYVCEKCNPRFEPEKLGDSTFRGNAVVYESWSVDCDGEILDTEGGDTIEGPEDYWCEQCDTPATWFEEDEWNDLQAELFYKKRLLGARYVREARNCRSIILEVDPCKGVTRWKESLSVFRNVLLIEYDPSKPVEESAMLKRPFAVGKTEWHVSSGSAHEAEKKKAGPQKKRAK